MTIAESDDRIKKVTVTCVRCKTEAAVWPKANYRMRPKCIKCKKKLPKPTEEQILQSTGQYRS